MHAFISGFGLSLSLILAIGAQNAFVLKQGIKKEHVFIVSFICALSDAILIFFGVLGIWWSSFPLCKLSLAMVVLHFCLFME